MNTLRIFLITTVLGVGFAAQPSEACATCACGDDTLTSMGTETAFAGRKRAGLIVSYRGENLRSGTLRGRADAFDLQFAYAYAPMRGLSLALQQSVGARNVQSVWGPTYRTLGLGDTTLSARYAVWADDAFSPLHTLWLTGSAVVPSPMKVRDGAGKTLPAEAQPSLGSYRFEPGLAYRFGRAPFTLFTTTRLQLSTPGNGIVTGPGVFGSAFAMFQPSPLIALGFGPEGRVLADPKWIADATRADSLVHASARFVVMPITDLLLSATVRVPIFEHDGHGTRSTPHVTLGITYDL